jgi:hypothetical protein
VGAGACDKAYLYVSSLKKHIQISHPKEYDETVKTGKGKYFKFEYSPSSLTPEPHFFEKGRKLFSRKSENSWKVQDFLFNGFTPSGLTEKDQNETKWLTS